MKSPRDLLIELTNAAADLDSAISQCDGQTKELEITRGRLRNAMENAYREINQSHTLLVLTEGGKVTRVISDCDTGMTCTVLNYDTGLYRPDDISLMQVCWTETQDASTVIAQVETIEVNPQMLKDVERAMTDLYKPSR